MSAYVIVDRTPPTVKARGAGHGWHNSPVVVSFSASDETAGVDRIEYSITRVKAKKNGAWMTGNSIAVTQHGQHKVWYRAVDQAQPKGNASAAQFVIVKIRP
jgi:cytochrome c